MKKNKKENERSIEDRVHYAVMLKGLLFAPIVLFGNAFFLNYATEIKSEVADKSAMVIYKPVGNGGAMYEAFHGPSVERREMYADMEKIRQAVMY